MLRQHFGLHPFEANQLPDGLWLIYTGWCVSQLPTQVPAASGDLQRTVTVKKQLSEVELRARLRKYRGYQEVT